MQPLQTPSDEHREFDQLCQELEDFEPLPNRFSDLRRAHHDSHVNSHDSGSLDPLILAGLVSPV